jgi:predicted dehydrogenase
MGRTALSRRAFLTTSAAGSTLGLAGAFGAASDVPLAPPRAADQESVVGLRADPLPTVRIGCVGVGGRGMGLLGNLLSIEGVAIKAVCDVVPERAEAAQQRVVAAGQPPPASYTPGDTDFEHLCQRDDVDLVYIATPWNWHVPMAVCAMQQGKHAVVEVPAATTLDECWQLVDTSERTQRHCMMLENCCYGETEMLVLNMVRQGVFGELFHGEAGYLHEARDMILQDSSAMNWRRQFLRTRDGNLYPTHGLGPVAQYMNIHQGDRFDHVVSMSAFERALSLRRDALPADDARRQETYACGDVNTSLIRTARGRTIVVQYSYAMSRPYSRINLICGTTGTFCDYPPRLHLDGQPDEWQTDLAAYHQQYGHPLWKQLRQDAQASGGHGGMDFVMNWRLVQCLREGWPLDMSVYDAAAWSSVFPLSIASVAQGSTPVSFPDFTRGQWNQPPVG